MLNSLADHKSSIGVWWLAAIYGPNCVIYTATFEEITGDEDPDWMFQSSTDIDELIAMIDDAVETAKELY